MSLQTFPRQFLTEPLQELAPGELGGLRKVQIPRADPPRRMALAVAETAADIAQATELLNRRYAWRGYGDEHQIARDANHTTFVSMLDEQIVGTLTLNVDSIRGLALDTLFKAEVDEFRRAPGAHVCELTRFAFECEGAGSSNSHLAALFHVVFLYGIHSYRCTDLFIEVNPRHRRFYEAMLGFQPIGELRTNPSVDAPSQLMWINVSKIAEQVALHSSQTARSRSLYALFLSEAEQSIVKSRLALRRRLGTCGHLFNRDLSREHHAG